MNCLFLFAYLGHVCLCISDIFYTILPTNVFINNSSKKPVNKDFFFSLQILGQIWHLGKFVELTIISKNSVN